MSRRAIDASDRPVVALMLPRVIVAALCRASFAVLVGAVVAWLPASADESSNSSGPVESRDASRPVVIGSKNFAESRLLGEMFAQTIEAHTDLTVERRFDLAGTQVCFEALRAGAIDLYPEYTGTGLVSILGEAHAGGRAETLAHVRASFRDRWDLVWLAPLGFENAYEIAVGASFARERGLRTISDLAPVAPTLRAGFGYEFLERPDGLPGLAELYGLEFRDVRGMQQALKYEAATAGEIDVLDVYTTDGRLARDDLVILEDDRGFFPPYEAAALVRGDLERELPEVTAALGALSGVLDSATMRKLNGRLQDAREPVETVARDALVDLGIVRDATPDVAADEGVRDVGVFGWMWRERSALAARTLEHLGLSLAALLAGIALAVPAGLALERRPPLAEPFLRAVAVTQTVPSIALLAFMVPLFGIGVRPALVALWIYSLYPILRNTVTGAREADPVAVEAATALGMTPRQVLRHVRLPLATPVILAGIRTAAVLTIGTATLAAFIGAGGLGEPIVSGLQLADDRRILSGAIPAAALAVGVDFVLGAVERWARPPGR